MRLSWIGLPISRLPTQISKIAKILCTSRGRFSCELERLTGIGRFDERNLFSVFLQMIRDRMQDIASSRSGPFTPVIKGGGCSQARGVYVGRSGRFSPSMAAAAIAPGATVWLSVLNTHTCFYRDERLLP